MKTLLKSRFRLLLSFIIITGIVTGLLFGPEIKAAALITWWNQVQKQDSLLSDCGLTIDIPGGLSTMESDWFPLVMNFNADQAFSAYMDQPDLRLTVLYNFPAFSIKDRCSRLYDPDSPYYNSFYGAYIVRSGTEEPYGFIRGTETGSDAEITQNANQNAHQNASQSPDNESNGISVPLSMDPQAVSRVPYFDYQKLVLEDFGLKNQDFIFDWNITKETDNVTYAGYEGWISLQADLRVSGAVHTAREGVFSYMQYGPPAKYRAEEYSPALMKGQIYARYFPENDVSVFLYIVTSDENVLKACDNKLLSKCTIK